MNLKKKLKKILIFILLILMEKQNLFYNYCQNVFLGGSIIKHGGQNPFGSSKNWL